MNNVNIVKSFVIAVEKFDNIDKLNNFLKTVPENDVKDIKVVSGAYYGINYIVTYRKPLYDVKQEV